MDQRGSWLVPHGGGVDRVLDMERRLQPVRRKTFAVMALGLVAAIPWVGWWTLAPLAAAIAVFGVADRYTARVRRPEYAIFAAWASSEVIIAASIALSGRVWMITLSWLAIPVITLSARFSVRGVLAGVVLTLVLMLAVILIVDAHALIADPPVFSAPAMVVIASAMLSTALMGSDIEHRSEALIDPLTGMLNRHALSRRVEELQQQSIVSGDPVGVIMADLDDFKGLNDLHGHATGDAVLREIAYTLRKCVRAFESAYRLGGEEFLILMPGASLARTREQAERLRLAVETQRAGGHHVTMSLGVAASRRGTRFDYDTVHAEADAALYEAKRAGRNRVATRSSRTPPQLPPVERRCDERVHQHWGIVSDKAATVMPK